MKEIFLILLVFSFIVVLTSCYSVVEDKRPLNEVFKGVASSPPYGVSIITIDGKEYIIVRTREGYGGAVAICPK